MDNNTTQKEKEIIINSIDDIEEILKNKLHPDQIESLDQFPDPFDLKNMQIAVDYFVEAISNNKKIKCICDSDCDGLGTYTLFWNFFLKHFKYQYVEFIITDRKQGYGFLPSHVTEDVSLYITADNGITSVDATRKAREMGANVIITDHHQPDLELGLPDTPAIVDPHIPGDNFKYKDISGTFVLWFFLKAICERLGLNVNLFNEFLPELGLTTISDVMPIDRHLNRFVVKSLTTGVQKNSIERIYFKTFRKFVSDSPTAEDIAFNLTPMINATQRITKADHGALFMIQETEEKSLEWFNYLKQVNDTRKKIQNDLFEYVEKHYRQYFDKDFIIIPGRFHKEYKSVAGIVASKLVEKYNKPAIVFNFNPDTQEYSGSGRTAGKINILEILRDNKYVKQVGGHKQALGITVTLENFDNFYKELLDKSARIPKEMFKSDIKSIGFIPFNYLDISLYDSLKMFEPFGKDYERPIFRTEAIITKAKLIGKGKNHLSLELSDKNKLIKFKAMKFFTSEVPEINKEYSIYFKLGEDTFGSSRKLMLNIVSIE